MEDVPTKNKETSVSKKQPPAKFVKSTQYDLFTDFLGDESDLSNTVELWDGIPKYHLSKQQQNKLRDENGRLPVLEKGFEYKNANCKIVMQPTAIQQADGSFKDYYPSAREELVEDVLRKIFTDQRYGIYDKAEGNSWVRFSLHIIHKEMKSRGKTLDKSEISEALEILSSSVVKLYVDGEIIYTNTILSDMTRVTRKSYIEDRSAHWAARLPALLSHGLEELTYRQYNYALGMGLKNQLSRWFHKRLSNKYVYADLRTPYKILYSTIDRDSGLLSGTSANKARREKIVIALKELKNAKVILHYHEDKILGARSKVEDVEYILTAHPDFTTSMKAANKRLKLAKEQLGLD